MSGEHFAVGTKQGTLSLFNAGGSMECLSRTNIFTGEVSAIAFSKDSKRILGTSDGEIAQIEA
jgi:WD40 repeat protein